MATKATMMPLPPDCAYIVQLHGERGRTQEGLTGRVEHIASGKSTYFHSLQELGAFLGASEVVMALKKGDDTS